MFVINVVNLPLEIPIILLGSLDVEQKEVLNITINPQVREGIELGLVLNAMLL
jgi:hypothetical protein